VQTRLKKRTQNRLLKKPYMDLRERKGQEAAENCIMRSFIISTLHHIMAVLTGHVPRTGDGKCIHFGRKTQKM
jgi:hypothetical protein